MRSNYPRPLRPGQASWEVYTAQQGPARDPPRDFGLHTNDSPANTRCVVIFIVPSPQSNRGGGSYLAGR